MAAFASAVDRGAMANLEKLYLSSNKIGDSGMAAFADAIAASGALAKLSYLNLEDNRIGDAGVTALAGAIARGALAKLGH